LHHFDYDMELRKIYMGGDLELHFLNVFSAVNFRLYFSEQPEAIVVALEKFVRGKNMLSSKTMQQIPCTELALQQRCLAELLLAFFPSRCLHRNKLASAFAAPRTVPDSPSSLGSLSRRLSQLPRSRNS